MSRVCVCKFWVLFLNSDRSRHHVCKLVVSETLVVICVCWIGSDGDILEYFESRHVTSVRIVVGVMCIESFFRFLTTHIYFFPLHSPSRGCRACKHRGSGPLGCKEQAAIGGSALPLACATDDTLANRFCDIRIQSCLAKNTKHQTPKKPAKQPVRRCLALETPRGANRSGPVDLPKCTQSTQSTQSPTSYETSISLFLFY